MGEKGTKSCSGLISTEYSVHVTKRGLGKYVQRSGENMKRARKTFCFVVLDRRRDDDEEDKKKMYKEIIPWRI